MSVAGGRPPDNGLLGDIKQDNRTFQSCQQYVWIIGEANVAYWLMHLGCCKPLEDKQKSGV